MVTYWQSPEKLKSVQVVVLKDPSGEQEALFDLTHGGTLISLRYHAKELLFGKTAGANVSLYIFRHHGNRPAAKEPNPYWSAFHPDQGGSSMGIPSTVAGVACNGERSMRAIAMMVDAGVDNSFQRRPLLVVWTGHVGNSFPIGSSTPFTIETEARWVKNPGGSPHYYLQPSQNVVNIRPKSFKSVEWSLEGASPWDFDYTASYPERCTEKTPCRSADTSAIATGRYQDAARTTGFAIVVPTASWKTNRAFVRKNAEYVKLMYGSVWAAPRHVFAVVLRHDVEGLKGFHFSWTVCAGSWKQAKQFAEKTGFGTR
ncbi:MAG: hypothetical protein M1423_04370 [Acidobacteria bacterium]|nr:hypothetical protein [Acidobacteriota bacterium]